LIKVLGPQEFLLVTFPGTAKNLAILLQGAARRDACSAVLGASTTSTPTEIPLMMRLRMGKFRGAAKVFRGEFRDQGAAQGEHLFGQAGVFLGIDGIHSCA
jgi:hypothetical protein